MCFRTCCGKFCSEFAPKHLKPRLPKNKHTEIKKSKEKNMIKSDQIYFDQIWSDLVWSDLIRFFEICWILGWNFFGHYWSRCFPHFFLEKWNLWSGRLVRSHIFLTCWKFEGRPKKNWQKKPPVNWQRLRFPKLLFFWSGLLNCSFRDLRSSSQSF